ncbi:MAG: carboxypeptidase regulatory-like domain-containing protein [Labilithrix sp.]|nr:carboxypeptidase regulatory-like domain-containing protein [Labilithrix sp.]MBX3225165.1 carboxypeptidase regulatory-like domain-containing protein [Labilithrix sp.]
MKPLRTVLFAAFGLSIVVASGCGGVFESIFGDGDDKPPSGEPSGPIGFGDNDRDGGDGKPCTGLCLRQKECAGGATTSLSGTVMDPAGKVPLYNVLVYVPNAPVDAIKNGATCDRCGSVSGDPLVTALTGVDGKFKLDNVPVGANIPLVVQIGKWRRQLVIPNVAECVDTPLAADQIRLPRRKSEGDIPQIALTTGGADVMECWLRKVGLADEEFTVGSGNGKVHFYSGSGTNVTTSFQSGGSFTPAQDFWSTQANLMKYDIVILSCEGITAPQTKPPAALEAMKQYANAGGRLFASHWHRYWFDTAAMNGQNPAGPQPSPFEAMATWRDRNGPGDPAFGTINVSFPKGQAMHDWLAQPAVAALCPIPGLCNNAAQNDLLRIDDPRHNVDAVDPARATSWITVPNGANTAHEYISFNTPIPAPEDQKCGRVVYSDLHVTTADEHGPWPQGCKTADLTPQEKALEFMLFDLSSCIQSDKEAPVPPPGVN